MNPRFVYMTMETPEEAERIGRELVEERLVACVNILGGMRALYWWKGAVEEASETVLIAKTTADRVRALTEKVKSLHSDETPCVITLPIEGGNPDFIAWIEKETGPHRET